MSPDTLILALLFLPLVGAVGIALANSQPNVREVVTLATAVALFLGVMQLLAPVLAGARPEIALFDILDQRPVAFRVEPLGLLFALIASGLWIVNSIYSIGYITLGLSFDSVHGLAASIMHLFNHGVAKGAIFLFIGGIVATLTNRQGMPPAPTFDRLAGLARQMPITCFGIVIGGLSLIGVPGTAGFITKWHLILAAIEKSQWWLVGAILVSSLLAVTYVWRFVDVAYVRPPPAGSGQRGEASWALLLPAYVLLAATIWFGFATSFTVGSALDAAGQLMHNSR